MGTRCADHVTPLYPQKLALTSPTGGGRSVGIVRSRAKATEFFFLLWSHFELHKHEQYKAYDYVIGQTVPVKLTFIDHAVTARMWASVLNVMS